MMRATLLLLTVIAVAGCLGPKPTPSRLAIAQLEYKDKTETEYLANDHGFLIQWLDDQRYSSTIDQRIASRRQVILIPS